MFFSPNNTEMLRGIGVRDSGYNFITEYLLKCVYSWICNEQVFCATFTYLSGGFSFGGLSCSEEVWGGALSTSEWSWEGTDADENSSLTGLGEVDFVELPDGTWMVGCLSPDENFWPFI